MQKTSAGQTTQILSCLSQVLEVPNSSFLTSLAAKISSCAGGLLPISPAAVSATLRLSPQRQNSLTLLHPPTPLTSQLHGSTRANCRAGLRCGAVLGLRVVGVEGLKPLNPGAVDCTGAWSRALRPQSQFPKGVAGRAGLGR